MIYSSKNTISKKPFDLLFCYQKNTVCQFLKILIDFLVVLLRYRFPPHASQLQKKDEHEINVAFYVTVMSFVKTKLLRMGASQEHYFMAFYK